MAANLPLSPLVYWVMLCTCTLQPVRDFLLSQPCRAWGTGRRRVGCRKSSQALWWCCSQAVEAGNSHGDSKQWWSPAAARRSGKIKSSIKVEQVALVDYNQKWLQLLSRSSDPKDHELCGPWIPSAAPHAGLQHLKAYCVLDWKFYSNAFFSVLETFKQICFHPGTWSARVAHIFSVCELISN